jgi:hypothetical protein
VAPGQCWLSIKDHQMKTWCCDSIPSQSFKIKMWQFQYLLWVVFVFRNVNNPLADSCFCISHCFAPLPVSNRNSSIIEQFSSLFRHFNGMCGPEMHFYEKL